MDPLPSTFSMNKQAIVRFTNEVEMCSRCENVVGRDLAKNESSIPGARRGRLSTTGEVQLIARSHWSDVRHRGPMFEGTYLDVMAHTTTATQLLAKVLM